MNIAICGNSGINWMNKIKEVRGGNFEGNCFDFKYMDCLFSMNFSDDYCSSDALFVMSDVRNRDIIINRFVALWPDRMIIIVFDRSSCDFDTEYKVCEINTYDKMGLFGPFNMVLDERPILDTILDTSSVDDDEYVEEDEEDEYVSELVHDDNDGYSESDSECVTVWRRKDD